MPLHIDYRPRDFDEIVGNSDIVKSIKSILDRDNEDYPHAWMFTGPSGCGKTTLARIIANKLGCEPTSKNRDFQEINASEARGIDTAREILSSMRYTPANSSNTCRIYLLDEVHQGTKDFQNSLLKALEDTPKHVHFMLCTTDPQKILPTIKNRCSQFEVEKLSDVLIYGLIIRTLDEEGEDGVDKETIQAITEAADGCPRQALVTLDQIIDLEPAEMLQAVQNFQSTQKETIDLCRALLSGSGWEDVAPILKDLKGDPEKIRQAVNGYMQAVLLKQKSINNQTADRALFIMVCFKDTFFYNGKPGLTRACAEIFA